MRALVAALTITSTVFFAELVGGWLTGSVALMADAMHMLSDAAGLIIAVVAIAIGRRAFTRQATYGYRRVEVLAALVNAVTVLVVSVWIVIEAIHRLSSPVEILAGPMMIIAVIGLVANAASAWVLHSQREHSVNMEGAFLHVLSDMLGSVAVLIAGAVIMITGWTYADVIASLIIAALVLPRAWQLLKHCLSVLLEQVPPSFDAREVEPVLRSLDGVTELHDLHLWSLNGTDVLASVHLVVPETHEATSVMCRAQEALRSINISHSTIQIERPGHVKHEAAENVC